MMAKKRSISFNKEFEERTLDLGAKLYGVKDGSCVFGAMPVALRFGVTFSNFLLKDIAKVTLPLNDSEYNQVISALGNFRKELIKEQKIKELEE